MGADEESESLQAPSLVAPDDSLEGTATGSGQVASDHHYNGDCYGCSPAQFHMVFGDVGVGMILKETALGVMESVLHKNI